MIQALERISAALVRTMEGSEALVRAVVEAAADHLSAEWVVFALVDGELPDARPRHLVRGPVGDDDRPSTCATTSTRSAARGTPDGEHDATRPATTCTCPIRLDGRVVGGFIAWTPDEREIDDTDHSVLRILAGQTAAALQNCALLDHSARLHARTARQADDLKARNDELLATQAELGAARQREVLDDERHRIARELHDSVTQYALSAGMHIELVRSEIDDDRLRTQLDTAKDLTRRAVEQLRSAIYALNDDARGAARTCPSMLRRLCGRAHARRAARRGAHRRQAGGAARRVRAVAVPHRGRGAVQHGGARARRAARSCGWPTRAPRCGSRSPTTASGGPRRSAAACARRAPPRPVSTAGW